MSSSRVSISDLTTEQLLRLRRLGVLNGCGPRSWKRKIPTPHLSSLCEEHDLAYWQGPYPPKSPEKARDDADYALYDGMRRYARGLLDMELMFNDMTYHWTHPYRYANVAWAVVRWLWSIYLAWWFYLWVRWYGDEHFYQGKWRDPRLI